MIGAIYIYIYPKIKIKTKYQIQVEDASDVSLMCWFTVEIHNPVVISSIT